MRSGTLSAGLACAAVACLASLGAIALPARVVVTAAPEVTDRKTDVTTVNELLGQFRAGDDAVLPALRQVAERCARLHGRPDCLRFVEFFAAIPREDRLRGIEVQKRFQKLYSEVSAARNRDDAAEAWRERRPQVLTELQDLARASRDAPDCTPAARALALSATIQRHHAVDDPGMDAETRERFIRQGTRDAEDALALFQRSGLETPRLEPLLALAWFDWARDDWAAAQQGFEETLALARHVERPEYVEKAIKGLYRVAQEAGDLREVSRLLDQMASSSAAGVTWEIAMRHASLLLALDEPERAAEFLARNKPAAEGDVRDWHVLMEGALGRKGDHEAARAHLSVLEADEERGPVERLALAEAQVRRREYDAALTTLANGALDLLPTASLRATRERLVATAHLEQGRLSAAIAGFERALAVGDTVEGRLAGTEDTLQGAAIAGEIVGLETVALLARAHLESGDALRAAQRIEDHQSRALRAAAGGTGARIDTAALRDWASRYEGGLVTWVVGADTSVVVHVAMDGSASGAVLPHGRRMLEDAVRRLREAAIAGDARTADEFALELQSALLPGPLGARVAACEGRVLLCVHGPLERLPFELLPAFAGESLLPVVLPGLVEAAPGDPLDPAALASWSIAGDPLGARGEALLPGARAEIRDLAQLLPGAVVRAGAEFDREALVTALSGTRALHLATHLSSDREKTSSLDTRLAHAAFELSGGERFGIADIARARPRMALVVLSACESAGGDFVDGEAAIGVAKTFLQAGTRNLLVTAWPVEDQAARAFTTAFHRAIREGCSPSHAAARARLTVRAAGLALADWAAFRLLGRD